MGADDPNRQRARRHALRAHLAQADLAALLVTRLANVRYLTGFSGGYGALLLLHDRTMFFTDRRYERHAAARVEEAELVLAFDSIVAFGEQAAEPHHRPGGPARRGQRSGRRPCLPRGDRAGRPRRRLQPSLGPWHRSGDPRGPQSAGGCHEAPRVRVGANGRISPGTPVTVEPGVYLPGFGGVRIEDLAVVRPGGHDALTTATKELLEL